MRLGTRHGIAAFTLLGCLLMASQLMLAQRAVAQAETTAPLEEPADAETAPDEAEAERRSLAEKQAALAARYRLFDRTLEQMARHLRELEPERAELLDRAISKSRGSRIHDRMVAIRQILADVDPLYSDAIEGQGEVVLELRGLLQLLESEDRLSELERERKYIENLLKELTRRIAEEKDVRAGTQRGGDPARLADRQQGVADRTRGMADIIDKHDSPQSDGKEDDANPKDGDDESSDKDGSKGEKSDDEKTSKDGDRKTGDAKPGDPKSSDSRSGEPRDGQNKSGDGKSGQSKDGQSKAGQSKQAQSKDGQSKSGQSKDEKPGDKQKPSDGKPGDQKPQDAKPSDGKPGQSKSSDGKPSDGKSQSKPGQSKSGQQGSSKPMPPRLQDKPEGDNPQQSPQNQQQDQQQSAPQKQNNRTPGREEIERAIEKMERAIEALKKKNREDASNEQDEAIAELIKAKEKLEEILRQLREEEKELMLAALEARFQKMLRMQIEVLTGTEELFGIQQKGKWSSREQLVVRDLAIKEDQIAQEANKALVLLKEEGSSVAFPEAVEQIRDDMLTVAHWLQQEKVGEITILTEKDIVEALKEMVDALRKELEKLKQQKQNQQKQQQGEPPDPALVDQLAELKMLRSLQHRVNRRTRILAREIEGDGEQALKPELVRQLQDLSRWQARIQEATYNIATGRNK